MIMWAFMAAVTLAVLPTAGGQGHSSIAAVAVAPEASLGKEASAFGVYEYDTALGETTVGPTLAVAKGCPLRDQVNAFSVVTIVLGVAGTVASLLVMAVIFGYRKDKTSLRERFILWLTIANLFYSLMCTFPFHMTKENCDSVMAFTMTLVARSLWFGFKYLIACYEILIMLASVWMLKKGEPPVWSLVEGLSHMACWVIATIVVLYGVITSLSYDTDSLYKTYHCQVTKCKGHAEVEFIKQTMQIWLVFFFGAFICWCWLRVTLAQIHRQWERAYVVANEGWRRELWSENDRPALEKRQRIMQLQRQAYDETIQPLEKYVLLYLFFVAPAVLLATGWCSDHTNLTSTNCEAPCEMVLAARATVSAVVYFQKPESRQQLGDYHRLWTKTYQRLAKVLGGALGIDVVARRSVRSHAASTSTTGSSGSISIMSTGGSAADGRMKHSQKLNWGEDTVVAVIDDDVEPNPRRPAQPAAVVGTLEERLI